MGKDKVQSAKKATKINHNHEHHHHKSHDEALLRIKRATGHLEAVHGMIKSERSCPEILQQLSAVISAL